MQKTIQGLLSELPFLDPQEKFYLAAVADKIGHTIGDALGAPPGRGTFTEGLLSEPEKKNLEILARAAMEKGKSTVLGDDYITDDLEEMWSRYGYDNLLFHNALGQFEIVGEDDKNIYIRDKYDFNPKYGTLEEKGGVMGVLGELIQSLAGIKTPRHERTGALGAATTLVPLLAYPDVDTRAPLVDLKIPKTEPGTTYTGGVY